MTKPDEMCYNNTKITKILSERMEMMISVGQTVLYGGNGVCSVSGITTRTIGRTSVEYYELRPVSSKTSTVFVPVGNEALVSRIRPVLGAKEIGEILASPPTEEWIADKNARAERFREIVSGGDCAEIIGLVRLIRDKERWLTAHGKHLHLADERILKEAEKMAGEEVAAAFGITREEALQKILA